MKRIVAIAAVVINVTLLGPSSPASADVTPWDKVDAGGSHTCGIKTGKLYCWGNNVYGQIGDSTSGSGVYRPSPTHVGTATDWDIISAGGNHTCGIRSGKLYCWGTTRDGRLGIGPTVSDVAANPIRVGTASDWDAVSAGDLHTCGIRAGKLYCWGNNTYGQTGNGSVKPNRNPTRVGTGTDWTTVAAAYGFTCGIRTGKLYCWGNSNDGRLGIGPTASVETPSAVRVGTGTDWSVVSGGNGHTCAIRVGKLYCWGKNNVGQVGDGLTTGRLTPKRIGTGTDWKTVTAGSSHTCAVRVGKLYCWGGNIHHQLGDGTTTDRHSPKQIGTGTTWKGVSGGALHNCAHLGKIYCWGFNANGQVGDGTTTERKAPKNIDV